LHCHFTSLQHAAHLCPSTAPLHPFAALLCPSAAAIFHLPPMHCIVAALAVMEHQVRDARRGSTWQRQRGGKGHRWSRRRRGAAGGGWDATAGTRLHGAASGAVARRLTARRAQLWGVVAGALWLRG
jgi:hypothetical protein